MLRMDEINKIRKLYLSGTISKNEIAKKFNRSWETIDRILKMSQEELENRGKRPGRVPTVVTPEVIEAVEKYFIEEETKKVKKKQRYKTNTIYKELKEQGIYKGSLRRMHDIVKDLRRKHNQTKDASYLPLEFSLGSTLQVDHGEADIEINGIRYTGYLFVASVPGQALRYCQIFPTKASEAWGEFHERVFRFFGGVFAEIIYDNDSVLVAKVLGTERKRTNFSLCLEEHYGFLSKFCNVAAGNEKGSVENSVGYCRRNYLPGYPKFSNWNEINAFLEQACTETIRKEEHYKSKESLQSIFEKMQSELMTLLPVKKWYKRSEARVNSYQLVRVNKKEYSVPEKYVGTSVQIFLSVFDVTIFKDNEQIATHKRLYHEESSLNLEHYLDQLECKPSAFWDCKAVKRHAFNPKLLEMWDRLSNKHPKKHANQQFIQTLILGRKYGQKRLLEAVELALLYGAIDSAAVENIIRQIQTEQPFFDSEAVKTILSTETRCNWSFDLSVYTELCKGVF